MQAPFVKFDASCHGEIVYGELSNRTESADEVPCTVSLAPPDATAEDREAIVAGAELSSCDDSETRGVRGGDDDHDHDDDDYDHEHGRDDDHEQSSEEDYEPSDAELE